MADAIRDSPAFRKRFYYAIMTEQNGKEAKTLMKSNSVFPKKFVFPELFLTREIAVLELAVASCTSRMMVVELPCLPLSYYLVFILVFGMGCCLVLVKKIDGSTSDILKLK